jgi:hypothetical protein
MSFDEQPDGDPHGECALEINRQSVEIEKMKVALSESVNLQSHYAKLLNGYDGGERRTFTVDAWLARLAELEAARLALNQDGK